MSAVNTLLAQCGHPVIPSKEEYKRKFDFPIIDYYKELGFDFSREPYEQLAKQWVELYMGDLSRAKLSDGVLTAFDFMEQKGIRQIVLSASERKMLISQLEGLGIAKRFEEILGIDNIYGDSKLAIANDWRAKHPNDKIMLIGDTTHDCKTAEILGADCFIVCSGHQCRERFAGLTDNVFSSLGELIEAIADRL